MGWCGGSIHLPLNATTLFLLDVNVSATGYRAHHYVQVTALSDRYGDDLLEENKRIRRKKRLTLLMSVLDGVQMFKASLAFVFKRQSTVKTK